MELIVNIACTFIGIIGTYVVMKAQERGQIKMNMQFELVNDVRSIWERMTDDFAGGEKSASLKTAVLMTGHKIEIYCSSRWFHHTANRNLRNPGTLFLKRLPYQFRKGPGAATVLKRYQSRQISGWM